MTDLHSHILPGIDDGASDWQTSMQLLAQAEGQGIRNIALTSHFDCETTPLELFLEERAAAFACLQDHLESDRFAFKLGCEALYSPKLMNLDLHGLCLEGTEVLLLELPMGYRPAFFREVLSQIQSDGIIPLIAHVERYPYVLEDPRLLADWLDAGAYMQVNGGSILQGGSRGKMALKFVKWGLAQVVATDAHSPRKRPPVLRQAMLEIEKQLGKPLADRLCRNAHDLFSGREPEDIPYHYPRKLLGQWV